MDQVKPRVKNSPNRCPYCHDDVSSQGSVACQECLARHHRACWDEGGCCASCSSEERLEAERRGSLRSPYEGSIVSDEGWLDDALYRFVISMIGLPLLGLVLGYLIVWFINDHLQYLLSDSRSGICAGFAGLGFVTGVFLQRRLARQSAEKLSRARLGEKPTGKV